MINDDIEFDKFEPDGQVIHNYRPQTPNRHHMLFQHKLHRRFKLTIANSRTKQRIAHKEFKKQILALPISRKPTTDFVATIRVVRPRTEYIEYRNSREPTEPMNEFEKKTERKSRSSRTRSDGCDVVAII